MIYPDSGIKGIVWRMQATLTRSSAGVQFRIAGHGQEDFFFAYALKNKALHWAASKWFSAPYQWEYCYVSINHFETATATKQQKGIAQKETLLPTKKMITMHPTKSGGWGTAEQS